MGSPSGPRKTPEGGYGYKHLETEHIEAGGRCMEAAKRMEVAYLGGQEQCPLHPLGVYRDQVTSLWLNGGLPVGKARLPFRSKSRLIFVSGY